MLVNAGVMINELLATKGTRLLEDDNALRALICGLVDPKMVNDRVITKVAGLLNCRWQRVKDAVDMRKKMLQENTDAEMPGGYQRVARETRCDKCPGLKWASESGNVGTLSETSIQMIHKEWVSATKT